MNWGRIKTILTSLLPTSSSWKAVLLSVGAAATFWLFNSLNQSYTTSINYPISFEFPRENYVITDPLPTQVQINVTGVGWNIFRKTFAFNLPDAIIPLEQPADVKKIVGAGLLPVISEQLNVLRVNYVITDTLDIGIERKKSKMVAITIDSVTISLEKNFRITSQIVSDVDSVLITGPESIISQLPDRLPMAIEEKNIDESFDEFVKFKIRGYNQPLLQVTPPEVNVRFKVEEFVNLFGDIPVKRINFPDDVVLADSMHRVNILLKKSLRQSLVLDSILLEADFENLLEDSTVLPIIIKYPEIIESISADTTSIKVVYE